MNSEISYKKDARPFGIRDKLGYLFGDLGNDLYRFARPETQQSFDGNGG